MKFFRALILSIPVLGAVLPSAWSADTACASVKMEVSQEMTLERQAFDARMRIHNGYSGLTLGNVSVSVLFKDKDGKPVSATSNPSDLGAAFFIRVDSLENISGVSGAGVVDPSSTADIHWLIIPAPGAAGVSPAGAVYFIGAELRYTLGGEEKVMAVAPDFITVRPMPQLSLDYFLPSDVLGDDAFTSETEPSVPFPLGVRVKNGGFGAAQNLKIESAQPRIVDNAQGLLVGFQITGCDVNGAPAPLSLLADFGPIGPGRSGTALWSMTASLSGRFTDFSARMTHADALGGQLTSLVTGVATHRLVKDVLNDRPGRDGVRDFLADDGGVLRLYESDGGEASVSDLSSAASLAPIGETGGRTSYALSGPASAGYSYVKLPDPHAGIRPLSRVTRSDGKVLHPANAWLSKTRQGTAEWSYFLNVFDDGGASGHTVLFGGSAPENRPPVLQTIPPAAGVEEQRLSFIATASDPDGAPVFLTASALPVGASFIDRGDGTGTFDWTPARGQAGRYEAVIQASDGELSTQARAGLSIVVMDDDIHLTNHPAWIADDTPAWTWVPAPGATGYVCVVDAGPEVFTAATAFTASPLSDGPHRLAVKAQYGLESPLYGRVFTDDFGVDASSPTLWSVLLNGGLLGTSTPTVTLDLSHDGDGLGTGIVGREISVDGAPFAPYDGGALVLPPVYGPHTVAVRLFDGMGNHSGTESDSIIFSYAVHAVSGLSSTGETAVLSDLTGVASSSVPVAGGAFRFEGVPAGLYGLAVRNGPVIRGHPSRLSLREGLPVDAGVVEPGFAPAAVEGFISPSPAGTIVAAGLDLGQGYFLELARGATGADGRYSLGGLFPGRIAVKAIPDIISDLGIASASVALSTGVVTRLDLSLPKATVASGFSNRPNVFLKAFNARGAVSQFPVDAQGRYAAPLSTGAHVLMGKTGLDVMNPFLLAVGTSPVTWDVAFQPLSVSTRGRLESAGTILDGDAEAGILKSFQVGLLANQPSPLAAPVFVPFSEEVRGSSSENFRVHRTDAGGLLYVLSDDPARDIHSINLAPQVLPGANHYRVTGRGSSLSGVIRDAAGLPVSKPVVFLRDVAGRTLGLSEGGADGGYSFKNVLPGQPYALLAFHPTNGTVAGIGPGTLPEGSVFRDVNLRLGDGLSIIHYTASVRAGQSASVTVVWNGVDTASYNLVFLIANDAGLWIPHAAELPAGHGALTYQVPIPAGTPPSSGFIYAFINHRLNGWSGRLHEALTANGAVVITEP
jgi:hypothetical protein